MNKDRNRDQEEAHKQTRADMAVRMVHIQYATGEHMEATGEHMAVKMVRIR